MKQYSSYERAQESFSWEFPDQYNPAVDFLRNHPDPDSEALRYCLSPDESEPQPSPPIVAQRYSFRELDARSRQLANGLRELGIEVGDRVGVIVPQKPANPLTHLANWKIGAVSVPLTVLFGRDALRYRLNDSNARAVVVDSAVRDTVEAIRDDCQALEHVIEVDGDAQGDSISFEKLIETQAVETAIHESTPETPSAIMYTSGSTGPPKGVLHSHALWLGRAAAAFNYFDQTIADGTLWTPADWAWGAALGGTLFAGWHYGSTVVAWPRNEFDPAEVFAHLERQQITHSFMPPTALRLLMGVSNPEATYDLSVQTLAAAGEPLTPEIMDWVENNFQDVSLNEFYGQTELNLCVGNCSRWFEPQAGSMGKPLPGYEITILDPETRNRCDPGKIGEIAVKPDDDRVFFTEYWNKPEATAAKQTDDGWYLTGDLAREDDDGYLWFVSRADDIILTKGYRVGPTEVEQTILLHPQVEQAGVIGVPDETVGESIHAYVVLTDDETVNADKICTEIKELVRERLAQYEYPAEIHIVDSMPKTSTGKIRRKDLRQQQEKDS